jgi:phosphatidylinositol glycan class B
MSARTIMVLLLVLGLCLRWVAVALDPPIHPDEYFQYLEPAWWHLTGLGQESWEWRDGIRSWVLPFYNGAWIALLRQLGVPAGATMGWLLKAHWALINLSLVGLAFRGGASVSRRLQRGQSSGLAAQSGWEGGLLAAALCAAFPVLVVYAGHTLSELPAMLALVAGLVLTAELLEDDAPETSILLRKAALAGGLISLGACLRIASGPLSLVAPVWLLARRRFRLLAALLAGAIVPALVFGLVDWITWGTFASSFIAYVKFNFIEGKAAKYGTEPDAWYLDALDARARPSLPLLLVPALLGLRATWPYLLSALGLLALLSTQPHKEERFIIAFWPFLLIAAAGSVGALLARRQACRRWAPWCAAAWVVLVVAGGARKLRGSEEWLRQKDRVQALAWAGRQPDIRALIADMPYTGGSFWFGARGPQFMFVPGLANNPVITHALVVAGSKNERVALAAGFAVIHAVGDYRVLRRR